MTFLNAALALGAMAFVVPLVIHLLFRSRFRTIEWGAMHLLDNVVRVNRRRIQLLHLLLLLLRCLLPVLLAFCLARPLLTGFRSLPGDAPQTIVLALDDSRSMAASEASGISRIDRVKGALGGLLGQLSRRDEVILVRSSDVSGPPSTMGAQDTLRRLREVQAQGGPVDLGSLLRAAVDAADGASHAQRRVLVVSDFQSHQLGDAALESLRRLSTSLAEKPVRPLVSFWNLGIDSGQLANVSVESIEIDSPAVVAGRGARFSARLHNAGDTPARDLRVVWSIDGNPLEPASLTIPPRSTVTSRLSRRIDQVGVHELSLAVEHADALLADNRRSIAVDVIREIKVLLVDGQPSGRPLESETDFLAIALSPFAFGGEDLPDAVRTTVTKPDQLAKQMADGQPDIVVLANLAAPPDDARGAIAAFVLAGGGLIVFDGDTIRSDAYNLPWACPQGQWRLPATLGQFVGTAASRQATPLPIGERNAQYTPWDVLGPADQQPFNQVEVFGYRSLVMNEATSEDDPAQPPAPAPIQLLSMGNGAPLVVSARRGRGQVVQFAVPCDAAWTTLPLRMVYLPMMQQLVLDLAGSRKQATIDVGGGFAVPTSELNSLLPTDIERDPDKPPTYTIETPGSGEVSIAASEEASPQLLVAKAERPGAYRLRQATPLKQGGKPPIVTSTLRIAEVPAIESQLRDADSSRLAAAAELVQAKVYADLENLQSDDRARRYGREIWRWLLLALLLVMVAELLLQQRSVRASVGAS
jgi:hypothetical protein